MTELLRVPTDTGASIVVEVDDREPGFRVATRGDGAIAESRRRFEDSLQDVRSAAEAALHVFASGVHVPDAVDLEFGVRLNAEAGAVIAKTSLEGHIAVKLSWKRKVVNPAPGGQDGGSTSTAS